MPTDHRAKLASIKRFDQLIAYLRDEMGWPIESDDFEELTFEYTPEELGIDARNAARIQQIKRLRPLVPNQPWGIFFVKFEPKRVQTGVLRSMLGRVTLRKRASAASTERQAWAADDLLFISAFGADDERRMVFAHFSQPAHRADLPVLKVVDWDHLDAALHLDAVATKLTTDLAWPADASAAEEWRLRWQSAFELQPHEVIRTSRRLAVRLAELARSIRDRITTALANETDNGPLTQLMKAFQSALVHDLDAEGFADMYAQTIAYGLLSARISDPNRKTADDFAAHMRTNPFLRELMESFLKVGGRRGKAGGPGIDFDELGVSEVVDLLDHANMEAVVRDFGDLNPQEDPVIHFYELFLKEYDAKKRMQRGVFYTPRPVVSYIVRSVDELLRREFGLADGLADTTTWGEMAKRHKDLEIPEGVESDQDFVQILDPATGTGTFLVEVIDLIHKTLVAKWNAQGHGETKIDALWNEYVPKHLLTRLHGYELLMAPYAIAHLKVGLKLYETGYRFGSHERARVYLTNALEPAHDFEGTFSFAAPALAQEAHAVNLIKRQHRFVVLIGNPPYAQYSMNLDAAARSHIEKFRFANGARIRLRNALQLERNLNDDYVKFLGFSSGLLEHGPGILGMITNRMFLDSESLVGVREWFATHFDSLRILDLCGSSEEARRVGRLAGDENVFDILQGVAISLVSRKHARPLGRAEAKATEIIGPRSMKYEALTSDLRIAGPGWTDVQPSPRNWWLTGARAESVEPGYSLPEIFPQFSTLIGSNRDHLVVGFDREEVVRSVSAVRAFRGSDQEWSDRFGITLKTGWNVEAARRRLRAVADVRTLVRPIEYRALDRRWIFFDPTLVWQMAPVCSGNVLRRSSNRILVSLGRNRAETTNGQWIAATLVDKSVVSTRDNASGFPLYLCEESGGLALGGAGMSPNLSPMFLKELAKSLGKPQTGQYGLPVDVCPEDVLHYIYAVLYSPTYRARYRESLANGFPRIPLVAQKPDLFRALVRLGRRLVELHLLESHGYGHVSVQHVGDHTCEIEKPTWSDSNVWLNRLRTAGFKGVREEVWNFHIGGYQVCEKWLKDRKGRRLSDDDIAHYQKIVVAISETIRLMKEIDEVIEQHGGWPAAFHTSAGTTAADSAGVVPTKPSTEQYQVSRPPVRKVAEQRNQSTDGDDEADASEDDSPGAVADGLLDLEPNELMCRIRTLFLAGGARSREAAIRELAESLGHKRLGTRIRKAADNALRTAVRRGILDNENGELTSAQTSINDYYRDFLKEQFLASLEGYDWQDRDESIQRFARWMGFRRTGSSIRNMAKSLINGLLREERLVTDGPNIRRMVG